MNKIKLLTPILGLTTITTSIVPLTSCGGDGKKEEDTNFGNVTKEEWQASWDAIWDISQDRDFVANLSVNLTGALLDDDEYRKIEILNNSKNKNDYIDMHALSKPKGSETERDEEAALYFYQYDNVEWMIFGTKNEETWHWEYWALSKSLVMDLVLGKGFTNFRSLYQLFGIFYGWYNATEYDTTNKVYTCKFLDTDPLVLYFTFGFDDTTKKLNKFDIKFNLTMPDGTSAGVDVTSTFTFGNAQVTVPDEHINNIKEHTLSTTLDAEKVVSKTMDVEKGPSYVYNLKAQESPTQEFSYNTIEFNGKFDNISFILDDAQLTKNIDYTIEQDENDNKTTITFYEEFSNKSNMTILFRAYSDYEELQATISRKSII